MTTNATDPFAAAQSVADAVLYEGYVLYPYHSSSQKNQIRWQFGVLSPQACCSAGGSDRYSTEMECLLKATSSAPTIAIRARFLQVQRRIVEALDDNGVFQNVEALNVGGIQVAAWDEAVERAVDVSLPLFSPERQSHERRFVCQEGEEVELLQDGAGLQGRILRQRESVCGVMAVRIDCVDRQEEIHKINVRMENTKSWRGQGHREIARHSLLGLHVMIAVTGGRFLSLLDPPSWAVDTAALCRSDGIYPVLIGGDDIVLATPIILYDHPEIAPESPGDLYDATEIDEILALRVLTLTDEEKTAARSTDPRSAAIIDRCDEMSPETFARLHGVMRPLEEPSGGDSVAVVGGESAPWWDPAVDASVDPFSDALSINGVEVRKGSGVVLRPTRNSDAQDLFLAGLQATVAGVFKDVDGAVHVAVTVDDDPANEELNWQGRYLFFHPEEIEPIPTDLPLP